MVQKQRRRSQNSRYMREILDRLCDYDVDEIRFICKKHQARLGQRPARLAIQASAQRKKKRS